ncbi:MAG: HAD family hydrolase [Ruminococcaceae bacterium]|nr:HAD family hydrolase [Oscillospiraceae bacterium]
MLKYILFDLDGTLLPMDQDIFVKAYFGAIAKKLSNHGYEPQSLIRAIWAGTEKMIKNDGKATNEAVFWDYFSTVFGKHVIDDMPLFDDFYKNDFDLVKESCGYSPKAAEMIAKLKSMNLKLVLATNPIFPSIATQKRIVWAGLSPENFELYTTYENSRYSKPSLMYYKDILNKIGAKPQECLMVGNDVSDDMPAKGIGIDVFLLTNNLINKSCVDISIYPNGSFDDLIEYIKTRV